MAASGQSPNPASDALLVIDMQQHFYNIAEPIIPSLLTTIKLCRAPGIPIYYTHQRQLSLSDNPMLAEWWGNDLILEGTPGSALLPSIGRKEGDPVVERSAYSVFEGTDLDATLKWRGVEEIIITGVNTHLSCDDTARDAFGRGFRVFFSDDATAAADVELHEASLETVANGYAYLYYYN